MSKPYAPPQPPTTQVWKQPTYLRYAESVKGLGGIVAPLLAGFSLTAIATLLTQTRVPPLAEESIVAFAFAVALLLFSMQVAFLALGRSDHPDDHLAWYPEARVDLQALEHTRSRQHEEFALVGRFVQVRHALTSAPVGEARAVAGRAGRSGRPSSSRASCVINATHATVAAPDDLREI